MEWLDPILNNPSLLLNPQTIIRIGGLTLLCLVVFAETGLLVGFFLPGDSLLFTAGMLTALGLIPASLLVVLISLSLSTFAGDQVGYWIGRVSGPRVFKREKSWFFRPEYVTMTRTFYDKYGSITLVAGRFLPIIRTFAPVLAGVAHLDYGKFLGFSALGAILWPLSLTSLGYFLGQLEIVQNNYEYLVLALVVFTAIPIISFVRTARKQQKADEAAKLAALSEVNVEE
jgi:membrane-associated protein